MCCDKIEIGCSFPKIQPVCLRLVGRSAVLLQSFYFLLVCFFSILMIESKFACERNYDISSAYKISVISALVLLLFHYYFCAFLCAVLLRKLIRLSPWSWMKYSQIIVSRYYRLQTKRYAYNKYGTGYHGSNRIARETWKDRKIHTQIRCANISNLNLPSI